MKYFHFLFFAALFMLVFTGCKDDDIEEALRDNFISATVNGSAWQAEEITTQKSVGENGPLILIGQGDNITLKIEMRGINGVGEYPMGLTRVGRVTVGNTEYSTLDVDNPGIISITRYEDHLVEGEFHFTAHWLSANNSMRIENGKFKAFIR